ncbi:MAG: hypothetical protein WDN25_16015 [Acetobacteraceae bacterium]
MRPRDREPVSAALTSFEALPYVRAANLTRTAGMSRQFRDKACT